MPAIEEVIELTLTGEVTNGDELHLKLPDTFDWHTAIVQSIYPIGKTDEWHVVRSKFSRRNRSDDLILTIYPVYLERQPLEGLRLEVVLTLLRYDQRWFWSLEWQAGEAQSDVDIGAGHLETFQTTLDLVKSLSNDL